MRELITILGARPQFVKASVVSLALQKAGISECIVHTGQHYDASMSDIFWEELGLKAPGINLGIGSGPHGEQTARILMELERFLLERPDTPSGVLVYGDTNSTLAGALAAAKLHIPVIHVEAGLRSFNRAMPEEINRIMTDHVSDILFCSSPPAADQLAREGITEGVHVTGDVMQDALATFSSVAGEKTGLLEDLQIEQDHYYLMTIHRPSNTDDPDALASILEAVSGLSIPVVWPVHPRNRKRIETLTLPENLITTPPASYFEILTLLKGAQKVLTDSGGLQKEAYWLKKPCVTLRNETEWTETLNGGWNRLTGADTTAILRACKEEPLAEWVPLYGDGRAAEKIAAILLEYLAE